MFSARVNFIFPTSRIMIHPYYIRRDAGSEDIINTDNIEITHIHNMMRASKAHFCEEAATKIVDLYGFQKRVQRKKPLLTLASLY